MNNDIVPASKHDQLVPQRYNATGLDLRQMKMVAQAMAASGMFPDIAKDSAKAFVKIMAGQEMGIAPFQAMNDISIIQGKAAAGGNVYASKVKSNPKYDYKVKSWDRTGCTIDFWERDHDNTWVKLGTSTFNEEDARGAQLLAKDSWRKYPRNMYFNRAMTAGVRTFCPDAINGINAYTPEELGAEVDEDGRALVDSSQSFPQTRPIDISDEPVDKSDLFTDHDPVDNSGDPDAIEQEFAAIAAEKGQDAPTPPRYEVPSFPTGKGGKIIHPKMAQQIVSWIAELGLNEAEVATLMHSTIGKDKPGTRDEAQKVLEALCEELNLRAEAQAAGGTDGV